MSKPSPRRKENFALWVLYEFLWEFECHTHWIAAHVHFYVNGLSKFEFAIRI